ncbi:MerR family DNA-binding protein [Marinomonas mediterranea]|jgi:Predicted transcriptional regulators|uniref:Transcriptional regulator, MerR family n=1 Tax=Marinomonas mediterranea (strain ATCC 700492 / JCM 21426 / NBRC 103028 / MMB-1) TaxID=717774 RepID=F2JTF8_MARM1|nr:MerR family transcriptional regulator [Marinomonas mediterranea]ADZ91472.1 transcriptional regulator, MerR family [Marinomonas mediterranea MMB-1]WCN09439.1 MerR family DNA-binding protein [Marinomonas mediterranea]WCN13515.1 MerR family DNA-binding protein [Marinomonas mediterranea]WCN17581.1 MerR family DNA-binding protein [Marinomonas mediterranea MMB-1]
MLTKELADKAGVTAETVRFYTRKGLIEAVKDPNNGYKVYSQNALARLRFITQARSIGFGLKQIEEIIEFSQQGSSPCPTVRSMLDDKIQETHRKIAEFQRHLEIMEEAKSTWASLPDTEPNGQSICCLIEAWSDKRNASFSEIEDKIKEKIEDIKGVSL